MVGWYSWFDDPSGSFQVSFSVGRRRSSAPSHHGENLPYKTQVLVTYVSLARVGSRSASTELSFRRQQARLDGVDASG